MSGEHRPKKLRLISRNIVTKKLFDEIDKTLSEALTTMRVKFLNERHRESFIDVIEDFFVDLKDNNYITQFKVVFDTRNNVFSAETEEFTLDILYRQPHCEKMTLMKYFIPNTEHKENTQK